MSPEFKSQYLQNKRDREKKKKKASCGRKKR
jgi:hypothetical protein